MASDFRDYMAPAGSGECLQLPLDPLVLDPAWSFLPTSPVVGLPGESLLGGGAASGEVPPLPALAPAGLGMFESSVQAAAAARGGAPSQFWGLGAPAATAPSLFLGGGAPPPPLGASPFGAPGGLAAGLQLGMPAGSSAAEVPGLVAAGAAQLSGMGGAAVGAFAPAAALPAFGNAAAGMRAPSPAAPVVVAAAEPSSLTIGGPPLPKQQQQQQQEAAPERTGRRSGGGGRGAAAPRSRSRGRRGGRGRGRGRAAAAAADSDSDYEAESAPSSDDEAVDESEEERAAVEARRKERLRAKNRRAQARYRLKQKALYEQQASAVEAATAELERQRLANEALRERSAALEKIASFKDLSLQALHAAADDAAGAAGTASFPHPLAPPPTLQELHSGDSGSGAATVAAGPDVSSAASSGAQQLRRAGKPPGASQHVPDSSASTGAGSSEGGGGGTSSGGGLRRRPFEQRAEELTALANREKQGGLAAQATPMQQLRDEVLSMMAADFLQDWADFGALAAHTLAELDAGRISEQQAAARLGPAVQYRSLLHTAMLHFKPEVYKQLLAHTHFPDESAEEAAQRWRSVALAMGCTRAQALQLREQYQAYCARLRQLSADSAACMRQLTTLAQGHLDQEATQASSMAGEGGSFLAGRSLRSMMANYLQLFEAAQRLARQPDAALVALLEFHTATGSVISGMQKARCAALYKPLFPDIVAIVRTCLEQHGLLPPAAGASQPAAPAHMAA